MRQIVIIANNIRSSLNVGALFRTADGMGVKKIYITGYTPYPKLPNDKRLPHLALKINYRIKKTSLGAEQTVDFEVHENAIDVIAEVKKAGYQTVALEQNIKSILLMEYHPSEKIAIIIGSEIGGIDVSLLNMSDKIVSIPMLGAKDSLNVMQALAMALYHCRFEV